MCRRQRDLPERWTAWPAASRLIAIAVVGPAGAEPGGVPAPDPVATLPDCVVDGSGHATIDPLRSRRTTASPPAEAPSRPRRPTHASLPVVALALALLEVIVAAEGVPLVAGSVASAASVAASMAKPGSVAAAETTSCRVESRTHGPPWRHLPMPPRSVTHVRRLGEGPVVSSPGTWSGTVAPVSPENVTRCEVAPRSPKAPQNAGSGARGPTATNSIGEGVGSTRACSC